MSETTGERLLRDIFEDPAQRAGSSVPEAARAAKWATAFYDYPTERFPDHLWPHIVHLMALADAEVAAASVELQQEVDRLSAECEALRGTVAEERATTGRRIEAALDAAERTAHGELDRYGQTSGVFAIVRRLRAVLASPGESVEHNESCCMNGVKPTAGPHPDCPGVKALRQVLASPGEDESDA